jgi:rhomboid family GlyGly-CTERM serine protease
LLEDTFSNSDWLRTAFASAAAIDAGLWWIDTRVEWYVGLSGVLHGFVAAGALELLLRRRMLGVVLALGLTAKLGFEQAFGPVPLTAASVGGPVVVAAHLYGAAGGSAMIAIMRFVGRGRSQV